MCKLLKLHYAKFDVSSLFCSKVIEEKPLGCRLDPPFGKGRVKEQHHWTATIQLNISDCKVYPSELLSVQDQTSIVSKHNTEIVNHLQIVKYTL